MSEIIAHFVFGYALLYPQLCNPITDKFSVHLPHHPSTIYCRRKGSFINPTAYAEFDRILQNFTLSRVTNAKITYANGL